jgi:hypothetical protein
MHSVRDGGGVNVMNSLLPLYAMNLKYELLGRTLVKAFAFGSNGR